VIIYIGKDEIPIPELVKVAIEILALMMKKRRWL